MTARKQIPLGPQWLFARGESEKSLENGTIVTLPHDWGITSPIRNNFDYGGDQGFRDWFGTGWYQTSFTLPADGNTEADDGSAQTGDTGARNSDGAACNDDRYVLVSDGIYENSTIFVNGTKVGSQGYGYTPFEVDVTDALRPGRNELLIKVEANTKPSDRWYSGAGIYRPLYLERRPHDFIDARFVTVNTKVDYHADCAQITVGCDPDAKNADATDETRATSTVAQAPIRVELTDRDGSCVASASGSLADGVHCELQFAHLWSAEDPYLYTLHVSSATDHIAMRIGVRDVHFDPDHGMIVNGAKVIFRGVCLHQDCGSIGSASTKEMLRARLLLLKKMGCNGLRLAHHAHPSIMLDLADELGFYVYAEAFDKWQSGHYERYFEKDWRYDLSAMIRRDRNRPSVVIWGVGNEVEDQEKRPMLQRLRCLVACAHRLDPSRPVTCALSPHYQRDEGESGNGQFLQATDEKAASNEITVTPERVRQIAKVAAITDICALNYSEQWYDAIHAACPSTPLFGSEVYQYFQGDDRQMQDYRDENPNLVPLAKEYVIGGTIWAGFDYLGESMGWPSRGWAGALVQTNNLPKFGWWLLRSYWDAKGTPFVHFFVADYIQPDQNVKEHWDIPPFLHEWQIPNVHKMVVPYAVITNCDEVRLWVNDREIFTPPVATFPNKFVTGYLPYQPGTLRVVGYRNGEEVAREVVRTPGVPQRLEFVTSDDRQQPCTTISGAASRLGCEQLLTVRLVDGEGNPQFVDRRSVDFSVGGPGELVSVDNGCLMDHYPYDGRSVYLWKGCASCVVRRTRADGAICVTAHADEAAEAHVLIADNCDSNGGSNQEDAR